MKGQEESGRREGEGTMGEQEEKEKINREKHVRWRMKTQNCINQFYQLNIE